MAAIRLRGIRLVAGGKVVLDDVALDVAEGERLAVVGSSGSGKTLLLRAIAGLDRPEGGQVYVHGVAVRGTRRDVTMVFQGDNVYDHLEVEGNLELPLRFAKGSLGSVEATAARFTIRRLLRRRPATLSAGQRRTVAAARALVRDDVRVVLLDEPLSGTDPHRRSVVVDSVMSDRRLTVVLATNEPADAFRWADRAAVIDAGRVAQVDAPRQVYRYPVSLAVGELMGELNRFPATVEQVDGRSWAHIAGTRLLLRNGGRGLVAGGRVVVAVRPPDLRVATPGTPFERTIHATVGRVEQDGGTQRVLFGLGASAGAGFVAVVPAPHKLRRGDRVVWCAEPDRIRVFDPVSGASLDSDP
ncbi:sulfate/molybdate ABC transporter ATP-binding protein [soil metagenome]